MSSLVRRGLMARTSSGLKVLSLGPTAELSRGTASGPLLFLLGSRGRTGTGACMGRGVSCSAEEEEEEESARSMGGERWELGGSRDRWPSISEAGRVSLSDGVLRFIELRESVVAVYRTWES